MASLYQNGRGAKNRSGLIKDRLHCDTVPLIKRKETLARSWICHPALGDVNTPKDLVLNTVFQRSECDCFPTLDHTLLAGVVEVVKTRNPSELVTNLQ